ncbi:N-acetylmuramoyl-L-alanine amidase family protein [Paenibacillus arenilitoris]|uniref:N-acetylmuramoyl-L-alanine amidase n=1 Tax=Paenibacillus arenilitoris TaxID=2772299 RepID=A0A927CMI3_9BACL|nr:N-acetylmuramoyl-L-alanine amidase [Paenibacillus arenilitoris]MBD2869982.1 N-acetylmuramoyl-L-alanine amidase [Paenibacillus arenilitoris]
MKKQPKYLFYGLLMISIMLLSACGDARQESGAASANQTGPPEAAGDSDPSEPTYKVVIDPGHGGDDPGATGASGRYEKDFTLSISKKVVRLLKQIPQVQVYMTREDDRTLSTVDRDRTNYANGLNADLFISLHGNTYESSSVSGIETFYYHDDSLPFAESIHAKLVEASGFNDRGIKHEDYYVLKETNMPAILLELGYLTNPEEEAVMLSDEFQNAIASSIDEGVKQFLQIQA